MARFAGFILLLSSISTLIYQMHWLRLLGLTESTSVVTTAIILGAFFGGLASGGLLAQWQLHKGLNGLKGFIVSQSILAFSAVLLLPVLLSPEQFITLLPNQSIDSLSGVITIFLILFIPTSAMGMAFPFITTWLSEIKQQSASTISELYALTTLGGVIGILLGGFYLIPYFGLNNSVYFAASINALAVSVAVFIHLKTPLNLPIKANLSSPSAAKESHSSSVLLLVLAIIAFTLMGSEVVWSKYLSLYVGTTLYGFSALMATLLTGVAIGAGAMRWWQTNNTSHSKQLFWLLIALFIVLNLTRLLFTMTQNIYGDGHYLGELLYHSEALFFAIILLPPTILLGAIIPLTLGLYCQNIQAVRHKIGLAYGINTLAAIAGSVITALWLVPELGSNNTLMFFATLPLVAAFILITKPTLLKRNLPAYGLLISLLALVFLVPKIHFKDVFGEHYYRYIKDEKPITYFYLNEGRSGIVSLMTYRNEFAHLQINGISKGAVHARHPHKGFTSESLTASLPYLSQPNPENALVIGFGAGIITRVLAESDLDIVKVVEIEPMVIEAMLTLRSSNFLFLEDGRVEVENEDIRTVLRDEEGAYSIITSQAPRAWLTGSTYHYSQEFYQLINSRLKEEGIFSQTFSLLRMNATTLQSILQTFYSVFPQGAVFSDLDSGNLILLGSNQPLALDFERSKAYIANKEVFKTLTFSGLRSPSDLLRHFLFSSEQAKLAAGNAKIITDAHSLIETQITALSKTLPKGAEDPFQLLTQHVQDRFTKLQQ